MWNESLELTYEGYYYIYFLLQPIESYSLWLWKNLENSRNFFLLLCGHPCLCVSVRLFVLKLKNYRSEFDATL